MEVGCEAYGAGSASGGVGGEGGDAKYEKEWKIEKGAVYRC